MEPHEANSLMNNLSSTMTRFTGTASDNRSEESKNQLYQPTSRMEQKTDGLEAPRVVVLPMLQLLHQANNNEWIDGEW